jgi:UDP-N-acetylglucosamine--N-acetylmuramyl-(pentapeptide) pyrophosphoryl-undecaprenol N-acetylglucosamine transferase
MPTILFTGGGSAGHVTPNLALIQKFKEAGWHVIYAGSTGGMEKEIIQRVEIPYFTVATGKLRRYFSWQTFIAPFAVIQGILQAFLLCRQKKPAIVFSKGGFVAFPVVVGAWLNHIPVIVHESDFTPGLANKLSFPFADKICVTFEEGKQRLSPKKTVVTGNPIRDSLLRGQPEKGRAICGFNAKDPILLILGGGQGAMIINQTVRSILSKLKISFQVAHICGKGKIDETVLADTRYRQFEYLNDELADIFACADLVISRAGANSLYELLRLKKPHILIPLSKRASRGDQIINAQYFADRGLSNVLYEENLTGDRLLELIVSVYASKTQQQEKLLHFSLPNSNDIIYKELVELAKRSNAG